MNPYTSIWDLPDRRLAHWTIDLTQDAACAFDSCASEDGSDYYDALRDAAKAMRDLAAFIDAED